MHSSQLTLVIKCIVYPYCLFQDIKKAKNRTKSGNKIIHIRRLNLLSITNKHSIATYVHG